MSKSPDFRRFRSANWSQSGTIVQLVAYTNQLCYRFSGHNEKETTAPQIMPLQGGTVEPKKFAAELRPDPFLKHQRIGTLLPKRDFKSPPCEEESSNPLGSAPARSAQLSRAERTSTSSLLRAPSPPLPGRKEVDEAVELSDERIHEPLTVAFRQPVAGRSTSFSQALPQTRAFAMGKSVRIAIKARGRILFIDTADIIALEAKGKYVLLLHISSSHLLRESISNMEEKLNLHGFVRIHRSVLVNAALVEEMHPLSTGEYVLRVRGGREFTVTRTYKKSLQLLAQLWIGMECFAAK
jgi:hypothetical protein